MGTERWHNHSRAKSSAAVPTRPANVQVIRSGARSALGDSLVAQQQHGPATVVPVVPVCQPPEATA
jgi:hypothetical protein